jgi:hypothetical protein
MTTTPIDLATKYSDYFVDDALSDAVSVIRSFFSGDDCEPLPADFDKNAFIEATVAMFRESLTADVEAAMDPEESSS